MGNSSGKIKWFSEKAGYGKIISKDGIEIFIHKKNLPTNYNSPQEGDDVTFEIKSESRGPVAYNIRKY